LATGGAKALVKTSGLGLDRIGAKTAYVIHLDGGKVTKFVVYWDRDRA
jgi:ketosteroid isomerase-like protein